MTWLFGFAALGLLLAFAHVGLKAARDEQKRVRVETPSDPAPTPAPPKPNPLPLFKRANPAELWLEDGSLLLNIEDGCVEYGWWEFNQDKWFEPSTGAYVASAIVAEAYAKHCERERVEATAERARKYGGRVSA